MMGDARAESAPPRRRFLEQFVGGSLVALGMAYLVGIFAYLRPARTPTATGAGTTDAGPLEAIPAGGSKVVQQGPQPVLVIRRGEEVVALSAACPHQGCIVRWDPEAQVIRCPCHAALFDLRGNVLSGPSPQALTPVAAAVRDGRVVLGEIG